MLYYWPLKDKIFNIQEMSSKDIQQFFENKKTGFSSDELQDHILRNITIKTAVEEWLSRIKNFETHRKYRKAMERIFALAPLDEAIKRNCSITSLDKNWAGTTGIYKLIKEIDAPKSAIKICQSVYSRFCDFIRISTCGIIDPEESPKQKKEYYTTAIIYEAIDWKKFISRLKEPYNLIAEMAFLSAKSCEFRLRLVNSKKNVLNLDTSQINFQNNTISFRSEQSYHAIDILGNPLCIPFPKKFMNELKDYLMERKGLVFLTKKNKPIFSMQVQREFKNASKGLKYEITPVMLGWAGVLARKENWAKNVLSKEICLR